MSTLSTTPDFPLYSVAITDWLPKIGEKAFLAWMSFHTWKDATPSDLPAVLPYSFIQLIKRLKVGNSTFYNQILRPLWNFGLIELEKIPGTNQFSLKILLYPQNQPDKAREPLTQIRDYDRDFNSCTTSAKENALSDEERSHSSQRQSDLPIEDKPIPPEEIPMDSDSLSSPIDEPSAPPSSMEIPVDPLPSPLAQAIHANPELLLRKRSIEDTYRRCKNHPQYTDEGFLHKARTCVPYCHDIENFGKYLYKALMNEWNHPAYHRPSSPPASLPERPHDVPPWVWRQIHEPPGPTEKLCPEDQAIADGLLEKINRLG
ncbi:hypothetical protein [Ammoniphilus sp. 3BR4]|uniref:hypothetical protein n=1 Tax=Ammoniphilus sp. 3BR4 TaxID=3158265 RepID=UPI0034655547